MGRIGFVNFADCRTCFSDGTWAHIGRAPITTHASTRTTQLYNRPAEEVTLDEVARNFV